MRISILQEKLLKGLNSVLRVVSSRPTLPILSNVLLTAKDGRLLLEATDLSLGIRIWLGAKVVKDGSITVPAKIFQELISSFPSSTVNLELDKESLKVSCVGNKARLSGMIASEFPSLGKVDKKSGFTIDVVSFREAIERVVFAASGDETRPVLSGVLWKFEKGEIKLVATDGYRLSVVGLAKKSGKNISKWQKDVKKIVGDGLIVPARALRDIERLTDEFKTKEVKVKLIQSQNLVVFTFSDGEVSTRLIEGSFPNYSQVIPKDKKGVVEVDLETLLKSVKTAAIFARDSANIVNWKIEKNTMVVSADSPSYGGSESSLDISLEGEGGEIAFNSRYLLDLFSVFPSERVSFRLNGSLDPGVFELFGKKKIKFLHLIMPVRVQK